MKLTFKPSPNYRTAQSTSGIMWDLTMCLCAVTLFSVVYYTVAGGVSYGLRVVIMMAASVAAALATDAAYLKVMKQDIKKGILSSYSWITAMILVLISPIKASCYAIIIATIIAVFFGKLAFGGFGQNIFNPAAFGEAIIMNNFAATYAEDLYTGATPTTAIKAFGWLADSGKLNSLVAGYGGYGRMLIGGYISTIGSTCALLLILCCVFLIWRRDIDWQAPVFYIGTVFVETAVIGLMKGSGLGLGLFNVLAGGVLFGGIFMMTDPVTSPVTIPGRIVFAVGAASLTVILRGRSNFADGVLYSILIMNMLTPAIDKLFDGSQIKDAAKFRKYTLIASVCALAVTLLVGGLSSAKRPSSTAKPAEIPHVSAAAKASSFPEYEPSAEEISNDGTTAVYHTTAKGFHALNGGGEELNEADVTIDLATKTVKKVEITVFGDTAGIGDVATSDSKLAAYEGISSIDEVDAVSGATFTSTSVKAMVEAALNTAAAN
ncbi:MAG: RnfABCDGE type electron transport complex subunit D [Solobacterium sp.]|nr:RnfABCDGE type electron transport complex subunit D [Solobacterium sp.]